VDLGVAVRWAAETGLLVAGGGHAMAAGLTIAAEAVPAFAAYLDEALAPVIARKIAASVLALDGLIEGAAGAAEALAHCALAAPFGAGFPEPLFAIPNAQVTYADRTAKGHVAMTMDCRGRLSCIAFRAADRPLGQLLLSARGQRLHLAGRLKPGWKGRPAELHIEDAAPA
jgi:single-stranded-DNA-specific exonuclease